MVAAGLGDLRIITQRTERHKLALVAFVEPTGPRLNVQNFLTPNINVA